MYQIRNMTIDDYDQIYALWMSCAGMGLNDLDDSRDGIRKFLKRNPATCFVAVEKEQVIGVIMTGHDGRRGYIYHTAVHPEVRKQKIASGLVNAAEKALKEEGIHKVALLVFEKNTIANAFWDQMGYQARSDVRYRNKALSELKRIDT